MLETPNSEDLSESNCHSSHISVLCYLQRLLADYRCVLVSDFETESLSEEAYECYGEWIAYDEK